MRHVDLCSGIGGFALGFQWAGLSPQPHLFCDIEPWCRSILQQHWPNVPVVSDVKELANDPDRNVPDCDIITAGYPCQPFSAAGKRKGTEDDRHIWPYILKIVASKRPTWCVFENVYGHISLGLDEVLTDLEHEGYTTRTFVVPACGVNAPHKRNRVWIIAHTNNPRQPTDEGESRASKEGNNTGRLCENVSNTSSSRQQGHHWGRAEQFTQDTCKDVSNTQSIGVQRLWASGKQESHPYEGQEVLMCDSEGRRQTNWDVEPNVGRVANGIPKRVDRIKGLGNAIVPQIAERIAWTILEISK
jgi:DNA (cytosine-5)-methyltransferase 1